MIATLLCILSKHTTQNNSECFLTHSMGISWYLYVSILALIRTDF